jgi:hypothetical protein
VADSEQRFYTFLLASILLAGLVFVGLLGWWLPRRQKRIMENERSASTAIMTLLSAEEDFKANDRDWNRVLDYWTGDVAGLYYVISNGNGMEIHLIARELAEADAAPLQPLLPSPVPYHGYLFVAMDWDDTGEKPEALKQNTDGKGALHHKEKAAFCAYPSEPGVTGKHTYIYSFGMDGSYRLLGIDNDGKPVRRWPKDLARSGWAIID